MAVVSTRKANQAARAGKPGMSPPRRGWRLRGAVSHKPLLPLLCNHLNRCNHPKNKSYLESRDRKVWRTASGWLVAAAGFAPDLIERAGAKTEPRFRQISCRMAQPALPPDGGVGQAASGCRAPSRSDGGNAAAPDRREHAGADEIGGEVRGGGDWRRRRPCFQPKKGVEKVMDITSKPTAAAAFRGTTNAACLGAPHPPRAKSPRRGPLGQ